MEQHAVHECLVAKADSGPAGACALAARTAAQPGQLDGGEMLCRKSETHGIQCGALTEVSVKATCNRPTTSGPSSLLPGRSAGGLSNADLPCFCCFTESVTPFVFVTP